MKGLVFGQLEVISRGETKNSDGTLKWLCLCSCGALKEIGRCNLVKIKNSTISCGCLRQKHGASGTPEYQAWTAMKRRCENPEDARYSSYGARGITVSLDWALFENFFNDVGIRPTDQHSLDRADNSKGYFKENVKWSTVEEQMNNKQNTRLLVVGNETKSLQEWCRQLGLNPKTVSTRIHRGWSDASALQIN